MANQTFTLPESIRDYLHKVALREPPLLQELRDETASRSDSNMQIAPEQGQFMRLLLQLMGARRTIEVGVFTGYSSLCAALSLPSDGHVLACDCNAETAAIARRYWQKAGVADKIDLQLAPAVDTLDAEIDAGHAQTYDFAFIDADKGNYGAYYERCLKLVRPGGLIAVDNTLWSGRVADPSEQGESTQAIRAFNASLTADERVDLAMLPLADGLTLLRKKATGA